MVETALEPQQAGWREGPSALRRVKGMIRRYWYVEKRSPPRILEIIYWPLLDILVWGFLTLYLRRAGGPKAAAIGFILGALILWDVVYRSQQTISLAFLEDVWSRNVLNVFTAPLRVGEYLAGAVITGIIKLAVGSALMIVLALIFYDFDIARLGLALFPFVAALLCFGWALGAITTALILRFGQGAEILAWALAFAIQPFSAVFYPVGTLPAVLRPVAWLLPTSHIFEGMRSVLAGHGLPGTQVVIAFALDVVYAVLAGLVVRRMLRVVRDRGLLSRFGE